MASAVMEPTEAKAAFDRAVSAAEATIKQFLSSQGGKARLRDVMRDLMDAGERSGDVAAKAILNMLNTAEVELDEDQWLVLDAQTQIQ